MLRLSIIFFVLYLFCLCNIQYLPEDNEFISLCMYIALVGYLLNINVKHVHTLNLLLMANGTNVPFMALCSRPRLRIKTLRPHKRAIIRNHFCTTSLRLYNYPSIRIEKKLSTYIITIIAINLYLEFTAVAYEWWHCCNDAALLFIYNSQYALNHIPPTTARR